MFCLQTFASNLRSLVSYSVGFFAKSLVRYEKSDKISIVKQNYNSFKKFGALDQEFAHGATASSTSSSVNTLNI